MFYTLKAYEPFIQEGLVSYLILLLSRNHKRLAHYKKILPNGKDFLGLSYSIRSPYETFIIHYALVGKKEEYHSDNRRTERECWAE